MLNLNKNWNFKEIFPEVSAYCTTWNCEAGGYPLEDSIKSFSWCDKIVVVDGGSTDNTKARLDKLKEELGEKLEVYDIPIDEDMPGKDGYQKSMALAMCATPFAIQFDVDEICKGDVRQWRNMLKNMAENTHILSLPVLEPFGEFGKIRVNDEHTCWKWRIFRTVPELSHGIPEHDRVEVDGKIYSKGASDGCTPIHIVTNQMYPMKLSEAARKLASLKAAKVWTDYKDALQGVVESGTPHVLHLGHVDLKTKIKHYLGSWHKWWCALYNKDVNDAKNNIYFPGVEISKVDDAMIDAKIAELKKKTPTVEI